MPQLSVHSPIGDLTITVDNPTEESISLGSIDLYDSLIDGFEVGAIDPEPSSRDGSMGFLTLYYSEELEPGDQFVVTVNMTARKTGQWAGDIDACTPLENFTTFHQEIEVLAEGREPAAGDESGEGSVPDSTEPEAANADEGA